MKILGTLTKDKEEQENGKKKKKNVFKDLKEKSVTRRWTVDINFRLVNSWHEREGIIFFFFYFYEYIHARYVLEK